MTLLANGESDHANGWPLRACCYGTRSPLKNIRARGRIIFLFFPRAARARRACALKIRQINSAILKVPDGAWIR
jgi:hypothetical protein